MAMYLLRDNKGHTVRFDDRGTITGESKKVSGKLTKNPIEGGSNITDHFAKDPNTGSLQGVLLDGASSVATLEAMVGNLCSYTGSYSEKDIVLSNLDYSTSSSLRKGFSFSVKWDKANVVSAGYVPAGAKPLMSQQDKGKTSSVEVKQSGKPNPVGLQTPQPVTVSSNAYVTDYVASFDNKPKPSTGPTVRQTPTYSGV